MSLLSNLDHENANFQPVFDPTRKCQVFVRIVPESITNSPSPTLWTRYHESVRLVSSLRHSNIMRLYEMVESEGRHYLVTESTASSLDTLLKSGDIAGSKLIKGPGVISELLEALEFAHREGATHRCICLSNIHLDEGGRVKLWGFDVCFPPVCAEIPPLAITPEFRQREAG